MPIHKTVLPLSGRTILKAAVVLPLAAAVFSVLTLPAAPGAAAEGTPPQSVDVMQRLVSLEAVVQKQQALIESQAAQIAALQSKLQNVLTRDSAGNVVVPGTLKVGRTVVAGENVQVTRDLLVARHLVLGGNLTVQGNLLAQQNLAVGEDLEVFNDLIVRKTARFAALTANLGEFQELRARVATLQKLYGVSLN